MSRAILLSPVGGQAIYGFISYFQSRGFYVVGADTSATAIGRHWVDEFVMTPQIGSFGYSSAITSTLAARPGMMFISWLDREVAYWNRSWNDGFLPQQQWRQFLMNFRPDFDQFVDKFMLSQKLERAGIKTPTTRLLVDATTDGSESFPLFIKPRIGTGSRGARSFSGESDLKKFEPEPPETTRDYIAQPFINGAEYTVDFFSENGVVINQVTRVRHASRGVSLHGEIVIEPDVAVEVERFCKAFEIDGLNNVQFRRDANGELWLIDFNPRPSGTLMLSIRAGVDMLENLTDRANGRKPAHHGLARPLKVQRFLSEHYYE